jgi:predicted murein hydrolase (TIGR00659 family)
MINLINEIYNFLADRSVIYLISLPLTVMLYIVIRYLQGRTGWALLNPLLIPMIIIIALLLFTNSNPADYQQGSQLISWLLDPAVTALAIPLYLKFKMIKSQAVPILVCCTLSIFISFIIAYVSCHLLGVNNNMIPTIGARSITTPLAMDVSSRLGGISSITACIVCCVGIVGAVIGFPLMKLFHIRNKKAQGLAMGSCAHAVGTSTANEHGEIEGAYSSLGLIACGILTTFLATPIFIIFNLLDKWIGK